MQLCKEVLLSAPRVNSASASARAASESTGGGWSARLRNIPSASILEERMGAASGERGHSWSGERANSDRTVGGEATKWLLHGKHGVDEQITSPNKHKASPHLQTTSPH